MALLRYALNDGVNPVVVQNSWTEETYYRPIKVVNGMVDTDDDLEIFALCQRGFVVVEDVAPPQASTPEVENDSTEDSNEDLKKTLRKMSRAQLNEEAGAYGLTEDAESFDNKDELIDAIVAANEGV